MQLVRIVTLIIACLLASCRDNLTVQETGRYFDYWVTGNTGVRQSALLSRRDDGSLYYPSAAKEAVGSPTYALSTLGGWSMTQPIVFRMKREQGIALRPAKHSTEIEALQPLYVFEYQQAQIVPSTKTLAYQRTLTPDVDYKITANQYEVTVVPLKPLKPEHGYLIVLTNLWQDSTNNALTMDPRYRQQRQNNDEWVRYQESEFTTHTKFDKERVILSDFIFTQDANASLKSVHFAYKTIAENGWDPRIIWPQSAQDSVFDWTLNAEVKSYEEQIHSEPDFLGERDKILATIQNDRLAEAMSKYLKVHTGTVKLPYFLAMPNSAQPQTYQQFFNQPWQGATPSLYTLQQGSLQDPTIKARVDQYFAEHRITANKLFGLNFSERMQELRKLMTAELTLNPNQARWMHQFNTLPQVTDFVNVPVRIFRGKDLLLDDIERFVIFQHGVGTHKFHAYLLALRLLADAMSGDENPAIVFKKTALVAIDHPLHGERGFKLPNGQLLHATGNPTLYMNLKALLAGRDNLKQSGADIIGLRAALYKTHPQADVHFVGHSLGAMTGLNAIAATDAQKDILSFSSVGLAMPSGGIAPTLLASKLFGPTIEQTVVFSRFSELKQAFDEKCPVGLSDRNTCYFKTFKPSLQPEQTVALQSVLQRFIYAAQTVMDSVDPINTSVQIRADMPIYGVEIIGDNTSENKPDHVIPNRVPSANYAGTEALFERLGLTALDETTVEDAIRHYGRFVQGSHSSFIADPKNAEISKEIQSQLFSMIVSDGCAVKVKKNEFLKAVE